MVIVTLSGGLGNQMFQYACGRSVAQRRSDSLYIHIANLLGPNSKRTYGLNIFNLGGNIISNLDILKGIDCIYSLMQIDSRFHNTIFDTQLPNIMLKGYWESEKYFIGIADTIRKEFDFVIALDHVFMQVSIANHIYPISMPSCSVRTDILLAEQKGFVGVAYYQAALEFISRRVQNPTFYIFSDDIEWCYNNLSIGYRHEFVSDNRATDKTTSHEFMLMCNCTHFIIANSTLSWWAAWLSKNKQKIIIAPRRWFRGEGR